MLRNYHRILKSLELPNSMWNNALSMLEQYAFFGGGDDDEWMQAYGRSGNFWWIRDIFTKAGIF
jgi:hypothetical protein